MEEKENNLNSNNEDSILNSSKDVEFESVLDKKPTEDNIEDNIEDEELLNDSLIENTIENTVEKEPSKETSDNENVFKEDSIQNIIEEDSTQEEIIEENFENPHNDDSLITVRPVKFQEFDEVLSNLTIKKNLDIMQDVPMHITVELGRTKSTIKEIINMEVGSLVELDKIAGEQVEIYVNEKLVARGEVIVIEDKFGVRVVNTSIPKQLI